MNSECICLHVAKVKNIDCVPPCVAWSVLYVLDYSSPVVSWCVMIAGCVRLVMVLQHHISFRTVKVVCVYSRNFQCVRESWTSLSLIHVLHVCSNQGPTCTCIPLCVYVNTLYCTWILIINHSLCRIRMLLIGRKFTFLPCTDCRGSAQLRHVHTYTICCVFVCLFVCSRSISESLEDSSNMLCHRCFNQNVTQ